MKFYLLKIMLFFCLMLLFGPVYYCSAKDVQAGYPVFAGKIDRENHFVLDGLPKSFFKTGILYQFRPMQSRELAVIHDGRSFREPLSHRQWRQTLFELDKNKLHTITLPDYLGHMQKAEEYQWQNSHDNRQPLILVDINFEWFDKPLSEDNDFEQTKEGGYRLKNQDTANIKTQKNRFFSAGLVRETVYSRLVTFALEKDFVYANTSDPIRSIEMTLGHQVIVLAYGDHQTVDLGNEPGMKKAYLAATHASGRISRTILGFRLKQLPSGKWANTVVQKGQPAFASPRLPAIRIQRSTYLNHLPGRD